MVANGERRIGSSRRTAARELLDAIGKLRLAYLDLEHAMHRAGHPPLPLRTLELERTAPEPAGSRKRLSAPVVGALSKALAADLAAVDSLITETEALQRQARTPTTRCPPLGLSLAGRRACKHMSPGATGSNLRSNRLVPRFEPVPGERQWRWAQAAATVTLPIASYSSCAAYSRCACAISLPSSAARNAARNAAFRM